MDVLDESKLQAAALVIENKAVQDLTTQIIPVAGAAINGAVGVMCNGLQTIVAQGNADAKILMDDFFVQLGKFRDDTLTQLRAILDGVQIHL